MDEPSVKPTAPEVEVKFRAPVVKVKPFEAVKVEEKDPVEENVAAPVTASVPPIVELPVALNVPETVKRDEGEVVPTPI